MKWFLFIFVDDTSYECGSPPQKIKPYFWNNINCPCYLPCYRLLYWRTAGTFGLHQLVRYFWKGATFRHGLILRAPHAVVNELVSALSLQGSSSCLATDYIRWTCLQCGTNQLCMRGVLWRKFQNTLFRITSIRYLRTAWPSITELQLPQRPPQTPRNPLVANSLLSHSPALVI